MKKIFLATALAIGLMQATTLETQAQVSVNINIGSQPAWGPVGYDYVQYYYMPEINAYYDVITGQYIFLQNRRWIHARALPPRYRNFDLYRTHKVVINSNNPYMNNTQHRRDYGRYSNSRNQIALRDYRGSQMHPNSGPRRSQNNYNTPQNRPLAQRNQGNERGNHNMQRQGATRDRMQQSSNSNRQDRQQQNNQNRNVAPRR